MSNANNLVNIVLAMLFVSVILGSCKREPQQPYSNGWRELDSIADRSFFRQI